MVNRKKKRLQLASTLIGLGAMLTLTGCKKEEDNYNVDYELIKDEVSIVSDTCITLDTYNAYLKEMGSTKELKEKDLENILENTAQSLILVKLDDDEYIQVNRNEYSFVKNEQGEICLFLNFDITKCKDYRKDLLTKNLVDSKEKLIILDSLGECIRKFNIENIGYAPALYKGTDDLEENFIKNTYGEDVWQCFLDLGIPRILYDVQDFYQVYNISSYQRVLKPVEKIN